MVQNQKPPNQQAPRQRRSSHPSKLLQQLNQVKERRHGETTALKAALRQVTGLPGYSYIKDIAMEMCDVLITQIPTSKSDNRSQVGAIYRQAFIRLFAQVEANAGHSPKVQVETLVVEKYTEADNL